MDNRLDELIKQVPSDCFAGERDISILSSSVFGAAHAFTMSALFGVGFAFTYWLNKNGQVRFYRSERENRAFAETIGLRFEGDHGYARGLAQELVRLTDYLRTEITAHGDGSARIHVSEPDVFFERYRTFFAIRQAVSWGAGFLVTTRVKPDERKSVDPIVKILNGAYKYNELVIPQIEGVFKQRELSDFFYDEVVGSCTYAPKGRSLLFIEKARYILCANDADYVGKYIEPRENRIPRVGDVIKGAGASDGNACGRVNCIVDLDKQGVVEDGDVLVTYMIRPQFYAQLSKVRAIITDEGGILSHAAQLARELGIPCICGTRTATQLLKTGTIVEVDGRNGVAKIVQLGE